MWFLCSLLCNSWLNLFVEEALGSCSCLLACWLCKNSFMSRFFFLRKDSQSENALSPEAKKWIHRVRVIQPNFIFSCKRSVRFDGWRLHQVNPWLSAASVGRASTHSPCTCAGLRWKELIAGWKNLTFVFLITSDTSFLFVQSEKYRRAQQRPHLLTILICPSVFPSSSLKPQAHYFILRNVSF